MRLILGTILAASVAVAGAAAAQPVANASDRPAPVKTDAHKMICKKEETIGSRLAAKKVCLTAAEWATRAAADREQTEDVQAGTKACGDNCKTEFGKPF